MYRELHPRDTPEHRQFMVAPTTECTFWEGSQQAKLRRATIFGKLVPDTVEGKARVTFVSEGEASLHFCVREGLVIRVSGHSPV